MEQMIITTGYLFFLYGTYLFASNYPADPTIKGVVLMACGIFMFVMGVILARRRARRMSSDSDERGRDFQ